jgi:hypothetical protein
MSTINLPIIGVKPLSQGGIVVLTRPGKNNPSPNGSHVFNQAQAQRIATRVLGFSSPLGIALLVQAVATSAGQATLSIEAIPHKAGDAWENKVTGQKGTYGDKNGGQDWIEYRNQEITLGIGATAQLMTAMVGHAMATAEVGVPSAPARRNTPVAITADTPGTVNSEENTNDADAENTKDIEA